MIVNGKVQGAAHRSGYIVFSVSSAQVVKEVPVLPDLGL